jgi:hypothetical protein
MLQTISVNGGILRPVRIDANEKFERFGSRCFNSARACWPIFEQRALADQNSLVRSRSVWIVAEMTMRFFSSAGKFIDGQGNAVGNFFTGQEKYLPRTISTRKRPTGRCIRLR